MTEIPSELEMTQRPQQPIEKVSALSLGCSDFAVPTAAQNIFA